MNSNSKISIIIPTYNERPNVIPLIKSIGSVMSKNKMTYEVIIVDDNSQDGIQAALLSQFRGRKEIRLFIRKKERGLATAILHALKHSRGNIIVSMDADFNHPPELIPKLVNRLNSADLAVASRFIKDGGMEDKKRYYFTYIFNFFLKYILSFPTMDNMSGFYTIKKDNLLKMPVEKIYRGYGEYHLRLVYSAKKLGLTISEVPVFYKSRLFGKSKTNLFKYFFVYLWTALEMWFSGSK